MIYLSKISIEILNNFESFHDRDKDLFVKESQDEKYFHIPASKHPTVKSGIEIAFTIRNRYLKKERRRMISDILDEKIARLFQS